MFLDGVSQSGGSLGQSPERLARERAAEARALSRLKTIEVKADLPVPQTDAWGFLTQMGTVAGEVYERFFEQEVAKSKTKAEIAKAKAAEAELSFITAGFGPIAGRGGITQYLPTILLAGAGLYLVFALLRRRAPRRVKTS